jgi:tetratricopeptide (TPR) repeat protein
MSVVPRVFVSAVSSDLGTARKVVSEALTQIECLPVEESIAGTSYGRIREFLQRWIDPCDAVIHLVGHDYGGEPTEGPFSEAFSDDAKYRATERRSWTQMEYDYAIEQNKKLYIIVCDDAFPFDPTDEPEPEQKTTLQADHRAAVLDGEHLWHTVKDFDELRRCVERLKLPLDNLRAELRRRQVRQRWFVGAITAAIVLLLVAAVFGLSRLGKKAEETGRDVASVVQDVNQVKDVVDELPARIDETAQETIRQLTNPEDLAASLRKRMEAAAEAKISAVPQDERGRWEKIAEIERRRDVQLNRFDDLVRLIQEGLKEGTSEVFQRAVEILSDPQQGGIDSAITYLESRRPSTLEIARRQARRVREKEEQVEAENEQRNRALQPLIMEAGLRETKLDWSAALELRDQVAELAPGWFEARNDLGVLLHELARYREAEPHLRAALALAASPAEEAPALNNLAMLLMNTNRLAAAETLMRRALAIDDLFDEPQDPNVARRLNNLASLFQATNRLDEAEPLLRRSLLIEERSRSTDGPLVAIVLNNLAELLRVTNRLAEAEPIYRRALAIDEKRFGPLHSDVAIRLHNLAILLRTTNRPAEAEPLCRRAMAVLEQCCGADHPYVANSLCNVGELLRATNRSPAAEPFYRRALLIDEQAYGSVHPMVARDLNNLALVCLETDRFAEAERLMRRAVRTYHLLNQQTGFEHPEWRATTADYQLILRGLGLPQCEIERRVRTAIENTDLGKPCSPEVERLLGPARPVLDVLAELDRQYKAEGKHIVYFLPLDQPFTPHLEELLGQTDLNVPLDQPISPHLDKLLGPIKSVRELLDQLDRRYREQDKPDIWFLPLDEPMSPHLDELLSTVE